MCATFTLATGVNGVATAAGRLVKGVVVVVV